jgi:uncharacterized damage-inducible protein DinB
MFLGPQLPRCAFWRGRRDLLDRLLGHDAWTSRQLLLRCIDLPDEALARRFDIGQQTLRRTFAHIIEMMECWTDLICERPQRSSGTPETAATSIRGLLDRLDAVAPEFTAKAREVRDSKRFDDLFTDYRERPPKRKTFGGAIAHLITHSMHHRAQALYLMDCLGVEHDIEGDVFSWEATTR